ncbi:MAG: prepilin-type N-terminal cleavage/methylation domain-containing protein [Desulfobacteraceae bacterium]|jgi:type IV pilus assembly protein PilW|nr:prepilin-type N-terminal cleavage/methylation domain-containing protein [Desulfobacteraceae bacterium]
MRRSDQFGFTLIELMIAMVIGSILMVAVVSAYQIQVSSKNTQEALTDMNTTARAALEIITHELSTAGCDPNNTDTAGIVNATANDLTFTMDIGNTAGNSFRPDGLLDGPDEQIRYAINAAGNLGRDRLDGAGLQPLARNVDAIDFVYLDGSNPPNVIASPVAAANLGDIRSIQITVVARAGRAAPGFMKTTVDNRLYTNQQGNALVFANGVPNPPNDSFRRLLLTTTVNCRNLGV